MTAPDPTGGPAGAPGAGAEERWIWRLRKGERKALDELARRHWVDLVTFAYDVLGSMDEAQDVVQDAFVRLWDRRREFEGRGPIRNYLLQSVRRLALNRIRSRKLRERPDVVDRLRERRPSPPSPDSWVERRALEAAIEEALRRLPARRREALTLVRFQGLTYREAAELMGTAPQTVANQVSTALKELREALAGYLDADAPPAESR